MSRATRARQAPPITTPLSQPRGAKVPPHPEVERQWALAAAFDADLDARIGPPAALAGVVPAPLAVVPVARALREPVRPAAAVPRGIKALRNQGTNAPGNQVTKRQCRGAQESPVMPAKVVRPSPVPPAPTRCRGQDCTADAQLSRASTPEALQGHCRRCYFRAWTRERAMQRVPRPPCTVPGCTERAGRLHVGTLPAHEGYCRAHRQKARKGCALAPRAPCTQSGCTRLAGRVLQHGVRRTRPEHATWCAPCRLRAQQLATDARRRIGAIPSDLVTRVAALEAEVQRLNTVVTGLLAGALP